MLTWDDRYSDFDRIRSRRSEQVRRREMTNDDVIKRKEERKALPSFAMKSSSSKTQKQSKPLFPFLEFLMLLSFFRYPEKWVLPVLFMVSSSLGKKQNKQTNKTTFPNMVILLILISFLGAVACFSSLLLVYFCLSSWEHGKKISKNYLLWKF